MYIHKLTTDQRSQLAHILHNEFKKHTCKTYTDKIILRLASIDTIKVYPSALKSPEEKSFEPYTIVYNDYAARIYYHPSELETKCKKINCDLQMQDFMNDTLGEKYSKKLVRNIKKGTFDASIQKNEQKEKESFI